MQVHPLIDSFLGFIACRLPSWHRLRTPFLSWQRPLWPPLQTFSCFDSVSDLPIPRIQRNKNFSYCNSHPYIDTVKWGNNIVMVTITHITTYTTNGPPIQLLTLALQKLRRLRTNKALKMNISVSDIKKLLLHCAYLTDILRSGTVSLKTPAMLFN